MIRNKAAAKQALARRYPDITFTPIYSTPAYIVSKPLDEVDAYEYYQHQLQNGQYMIFIGVDGTEVNKWITQITTGTVPKRQYNRTVLTNTVPTTFSAFTKWCDRNNISWIDRKFHAAASPAELLVPDHTDDSIVAIAGCVAPHLVRAWYAYELDNSSVRENQLDKVPHVRGETTTILLIKAASSSYISRRQQLLNKIRFMTPIYDQLKDALASSNDSLAEMLTKQYFSAQFDIEPDSIVVNIEKVKEAYYGDRLQDYVRDFSNVVIESGDGF